MFYCVMLLSVTRKHFFKVSTGGNFKEMFHRTFTWRSWKTYLLSTIWIVVLMAI